MTSLFEMPPTELPTGSIEWREAQNARSATSRPQRRDISWLLRERHYLGPITRDRYVFGGFVGSVAVAAHPASGVRSGLRRQAPARELEPSPVGGKMHARFVRWLRAHDETVTTLVSYSDPSVGHTGALYKACNWTWAPTWHRLRPPPTGNGSWDGVTAQSVKDRWVFPLRLDLRRDEILRVKDDSLLREERP